MIAIVSGDREPAGDLTWSSDSESDISEEASADFPTTTELQGRYLEVTHIIACLYRFSIVLHNPTPRDRIEKSASIDLSHFEIFDIEHASHKFAGAPEYLITRLGKANTTRRRLLKYYTMHHERIARYIDDVQAPVLDQRPISQSVMGGENEEEVAAVVESPQDFVSGSREAAATVTSTLNTQTTVSTFVENPFSKIPKASSEDGQSQTSYATSVGDAGGYFHVPSPPNIPGVLDGCPFECPYCFVIVVVNSGRSWK